jgi:hypothetical protein
LCTLVLVDIEKNQICSFISSEDEDEDEDEDKD